MNEIFHEEQTTLQRCPEGTLRYPKMKLRSDFGNDASAAPCVHSLTEQKEKYRLPPKKPKIVTREARLEQYWWHEFYEEYIRSIERTVQIHNMPNSEYTDNYSKKVESSSIDELIDKFPLYASNGISFYNKDGDKTCNFRRNYAITKPVYLQDEQFG